MTPSFKVFVHRNPWPSSTPDGVLVQKLVTAACIVAENFGKLIAGGEVEEGRDSLAIVVLDPTRQRKVVSLEDRILATILIGPNAEAYVGNAAAKADAHDRHGLNNGQLVDAFNHCLTDGDFAYGMSAEFECAIAGASGLSIAQDGALALDFLGSAIPAIRQHRAAWLAERRRAGRHRWFNEANTPGPEYRDLLGRLPQLATYEP